MVEPFNWQPAITRNRDALLRIVLAAGEKQGRHPGA